MLRRKPSRRPSYSVFPEIERLDERVLLSATHVVAHPQTPIHPQTPSHAHQPTIAAIQHFDAPVDNRVAVSMTIAATTRLYGQNLTLFAALTRTDTRAPLYGQPIDFLIDGINVGTANIGTYAQSATLQLSAASLAQFDVGKHDVQAVFAGDTYFQPNSVHSTYVVYQSAAYISSRLVAGATGSTISVTAAMIDAHSRVPLAGKSITVVIDNQVYTTLTTDSAGKCSYTYTIPQPNWHTVKYLFAGDVDYKPGIGIGAIAGT